VYASCIYAKIAGQMLLLRSGRIDVLPRRWAVERMLAWLGKCRRLSKDWMTEGWSCRCFYRWRNLNRRIALRTESTTKAMRTFWDHAHFVWWFSDTMSTNPKTDIQVVLEATDWPKNARTYLNWT
jgi:hypothetical protein